LAGSARSFALCTRARIFVFAVRLLYRNQHESLPASTMCQWWVSRSSGVAVILASNKT